MVLKMARPTRRRGSAVLQFKQRVPKELRPKAIGHVVSVPVGETVASCRIGPSTEIIQFSLRTHDPETAKARHAVALAAVEAFWQSLRSGPVRLSHRQVVALSGEIYREVVSAVEDDPGTPDRWEWFRGYAEHLFLRTKPQQAGTSGIAIVDRALARNGLFPDIDSIERLLAEIRRVLIEAADRLRGNALGDYGPDPNLSRFPPVNADPPAKVDTVRAGGTTLTELLEGWWTEQRAVGLSKATYTNYRGTVRRLIAFLGHDDAKRIGPQDIVRFKDHRLAEGISPRTVKDADLAALKSILGWATSNFKLVSNAAQGVTLRRGRTQTTRSKGFSEEEAAQVLKAATSARRGKEREKTWLAKRWVPWVLAYTGARVGEIVQLRKQDVSRQGDHWEILITPEAGTVKAGGFRRVPLHPHLIELGFADMVAKRPDGHLFISVNGTTGDILGPVQGVKNRVTEFVRQVVPDKRIAPNHAWRHRFVTLCREIGIDEEKRNMIVGHAGRTVAAREYGEPAGLYREICRIPKIDLSRKTEAVAAADNRGSEGEAA